MMRYIPIVSFLLLFILLFSGCAVPIAGDEACLNYLGLMLLAIEDGDIDAAEELFAPGYFGASGFEGRFAEYHNSWNGQYYKIEGMDAVNKSGDEPTLLYAYRLVTAGQDYIAVVERLDIPAGETGLVDFLFEKTEKLQAP